MRVVGLISGTSVDGIDAALVEIQGQGYDLSVSLLAAQTYAYAPALQGQILAVCSGEPLTMAALADLDDAIAAAFAQAAIAIQQDQPQAELIGSHGQTVFHRPAGTSLGYSLQLGRGAAIARLSHTAVVSNLRAADIALGGQGAPLVPPVDACLLSHPTQATCVQNLGGIGNVAYLPSWNHQPPLPPGLLGWDTGPGNSLLDLAIARLSQGQQTYDHNGQLAAKGEPNQALIDHWLTHPYFQQPPPKSTGRELFGWDFLDQYWPQLCALSDADVLATLTDFTALSIVQSYARFLPQVPATVLLCGGGQRNDTLRQRLQHHLDHQFGAVTVESTATAGVDPDYKEAIACAVLAWWRLHEIPGNLPTVTGAKRAVVLGDYSCP
jgi:anhydro-N-acetylmuramic acid kinase